MAYTAFCDEKQEYLNRVTPQGTAESIPHIPEKNYGDTYTTKLLNSDAIQERLDIMRAKAEISAIPFNEEMAKGHLIAQIAGDMTKEAKMEYDQFIPAKNPEKLMEDLIGFYKKMTGEDLKEACYKPENEQKIKKLTGRDDITGLSEIERAAALTAVQKTTTLMESADLRNTNTLAQYHIVTVENKSANPLGFHASRIAALPEEAQEKIKPHADKLLPVTHDGALWHEMTHTLGTDNETFCEGFRFLKTLKEYKEPALLLPDFNARLYNNLYTLNTIRKDAVAGERTLEGNFTYLMPKMMKHLMENADSLGKDLKSMSDAEIMKKTMQIATDCSYDKKTEEAFRSLSKNCEDEKALAKMMLTVYKNGEKNPKTADVYPLAKDMFDLAKMLDSKITPEAFFKPENFSSQSRNIGKEKRKEQDIVLSGEEKKHYQELYNKIKEERPNVTGKDFDILFAEAIVKDAWAQKAKEEAKLEDPKQAASVLFDKDKSAEMTKRINTGMAHARNAARIAKEYGPDFEKRRTDKSKAPATAAKESGKPRKTSLMNALNAQKEARLSRQIASAKKVNTH